LTTLEAVTALRNDKHHLGNRVPQLGGTVGALEEQMEVQMTRIRLLDATLKTFKSKPRSGGDSGEFSAGEQQTQAETDRV
jgi:hypothetical protein